MPTIPLETRAIKGLEILRTGRWNNRNYTLGDLDAAVTAFVDTRGIYDPPGKLGHNKQQALIAADGLPAVGWVSDIYRVGDRLLADFRDVPAKFAQLIEAGAYKKRSAELWLGIEMGGKTHPVMVKAVSWLGADVPAVKAMSDVLELYTDPYPAEEVVLVDTDDSSIVLDDSFERIRSAVQDALNETYPWPAATADMGVPVADDARMEAPSPAVRDIYSDRVIVSDCGGDSLFSILFTMDESGEVTFGPPVAVKIEYTAVPASTVEMTEPPPSPVVEPSRGIETMEDIEIRSILGLAEGADLKQALLTMKAQHVELSDHQAVITERDAAVAELSDIRATTAVAAGLKDGKILPKQAEWAKTYALRDLDGFTEFLTQAEPQVVLGEQGAGGGTPVKGILENAVGEATQADRDVAKNMGIPVERLIESRQRAAAKVETAA